MSEQQKDLGKHYRFEYKGVKMDPYRILEVYGITNPAQQHLIKKALRAGKSVKTLRQDVEELIVTANRWLQMMDEDETPMQSLPRMGKPKLPEGKPG